MTLEQLYYVSEIVGVLVVAVTLIFLTIQVRQNTQALRSAAAQNALEMAEAMYEPIMGDPVLAELLPRGMVNPDSLNDIEMARFTAFWQNGFFTAQNWFFQWKQGALDAAIWAGWSKIFADISHTPGVGRFWQLRRQYFSDEFRKYMETDLFAQKPTPDYRPLGTSPIKSDSN